MTEDAVRREYLALREVVSSIAQKITEIESDRDEHEVTRRTLEPMEGTRKCCRLIGGVLVERTVAEVLPVIKQNLNQIDKLLATLMENLRAAEKQSAEFREKHGLNVARAPDSGKGDFASALAEGARRTTGVVV